METKGGSGPEHLKLPISVIILTYNEEKNLSGCLDSLAGWVEDIYVVDSFSTDNTVDIAQGYGAKVVQHPFENHARQLNWAIENLPVKSGWVMRMDADEFVMPDLKEELAGKLHGFGADIAGLYIKRRLYFMDRWVRHGFYPVWLLRIWRRNMAYCEDRCMDEHMKLTQGGAAMLDCDIVDCNRKPLDWWTGKHNSYAAREAVEILNQKYRFLDKEQLGAALGGTQEKRTRWIKEKVYNKMPLFVRPFLYFVYRYFFRLGFLDGREGLIWHFLQGFWYRFLVDAKIFEIDKRAASEKKDVRDVIRELYGIKVDL